MCCVRAHVRWRTDPLYCVYFSANLFGLLQLLYNVKPNICNVCLLSQVYLLFRLILWVREYKRTMYLYINMNCVPSIMVDSATEDASGNGKGDSNKLKLWFLPKNRNHLNIIESNIEVKSSIFNTYCHEQESCGFLE